MEFKDRWPLGKGDHFTVKPVCKDHPWDLGHMNFIIYCTCANASDTLAS